MTDGTSRALQLPATRAAPRLGREFVRAALVDWGVGQLTDTATLLASEVVTNAVLHAGTASTLCVERTGRAVRISVTDGGRGVARHASPRPGVAGGHGLALVDQLAQRWGARRVDGGHEVWFDLEVPARERTADDEETE